MSTYQAAIFGSSFVMFLFAYISFQLIGDENDIWNQVAALLMMLSSIVMSWGVASAANAAAADTGNALLATSTTVVFLTSVISGTLVFFYFLFKTGFGGLLEIIKLHNNRGGRGR